MRTRRHALLSSVLIPIALATLLVAPVSADEGMWLFNEFPAERFEAEHGFVPSREWLDDVQAAAVRFNNGGSGSFVSATGLVMTNHHVGFDCIQKLSSAEHDIVSDGFVAASRSDELACPDLELNVLVSIERVTGRVRGAVEEGMNPSAAGEARRGAIVALEAECNQATGLRCNVVKLYAGGEYDLYRYRRHTDVRLVWAPELQLANFGGDPDNFEYPRYNLDAALFRVYEDGAPYAPESWLPLDPEGAKEGEVSFLVGNPGSSGRLSTMAELKHLRDFTYPFVLELLGHEHSVLSAYSARGEEQERVARDALLGVENGLKAVSGYMSGLLNDDLMARKAAEEAEIRQRVRDDPELAQRIGDPWSEMAEALELERTLFHRNLALGGVSEGRLAGTAWKIVRLAAESQRPDADRLAPYREPARPSLLQQIYSEAPIYPDYEVLQLTGGLKRFLHQFGPTHPLVVEVLGERSPAEVARAAVEGTRVGDVDYRRQLVEGGAETVRSSDDPMIALLRKLEPHAREVTTVLRDRVSAVEDDAGGRIAEAFFAVRGRDTYPDATFTLRLTYGRVTGYRQGETDVPWKTDIGGLFARAERFGHQPPFHLPTDLAAAKEEGKVDLTTPLNFVSTHDIIGGNSGSPVIDREGNFIGIVFDGNLQMLPNRFVYDVTTSRAISVDARAILEALTAVYPARHVADELLGKEAPAAGNAEAAE